MAAQFSNEEYTDMILVYGFCEGNARLCVRVYGERFPNRRLPNHTTFTAVVRRLRETGRFAARTADYGRNRFVRTADVEEEILARGEADPELSTRRIGAEMEMSKDVVHRTLKEQLLHPYHKTPIQDRLVQDPGSRRIRGKTSRMGLVTRVPGPQDLLISFDV
ncbi:hypothetical protein NQ318_006238 [Aromia moschata]|uniref:DUF4817 domain-containing protein n=1 Tax=Aromia moschata TaxID=1265417 RepID=A0AAV8XUS5_9CUCU|nr:hypothetical protein NQ318_006238 [Aromia moschata]